MSWFNRKELDIQFTEYLLKAVKAYEARLSELIGLLSQIRGI